ncbi:hypothetical protein SAMN03080617_02119 [Algoriphagus alkaliphilus]|uniref:Uncharacterized protein n=1 Tax=Algoriphagus alkaliphilus TaxID=279824 RepID=A0A1G5XZX5_9BACT|nr:hypothetical protein [Algoriphagus alkaliphilus]SDA75902.1 hypothetical protein SAMN03080617_02119 [Algoriphagus alkaliphilus]
MKVEVVWYRKYYEILFKNFFLTIYPKPDGMILKLLSFNAINPKDL